MSMPTQDTFSFALVLLCLAVGEIDYVVTHVRNTSVMYAGGARPPIPESLDPRIAQLIKDMWQGDFRLRPAMKSVVTRLEACSMLQDGVPTFSEESGSTPVAATGPEISE